MIGSVGSWPAALWLCSDTTCAVIGIAAPTARPAAASVAPVPISLRRVIGLLSSGMVVSFSPGRMPLPAWYSAGPEPRIGRAARSFRRLRRLGGEDLDHA